MKGKTICNGIRPGIGIGGDRSQGLVSLTGWCELVRVDVDESEVLCTEDENGVKPGGGRIMRILRAGKKGGAIVDRIKGGNIMDSGVEMRSDGGTVSVIGSLERREEGSRRRG